MRLQRPPSCYGFPVSAIDLDPLHLLPLAAFGGLLLPGGATAGSHQVSLNAGVSVAFAPDPKPVLSLGADWRMLLTRGVPVGDWEDGWEFTNVAVPSTGAWSRLNWRGPGALAWSGGARGGMAWEWCCGEQVHLATLVTEAELGFTGGRERVAGPWFGVATTVGRDVEVDCSRARREPVLVGRAGVARAGDWEHALALEVAMPLLPLLTQLGYWDLDNGCWAAGRPCRGADGRPRLPAVTTPGSVDRTAAAWLRDGADELASVATFLRLRVELAALGAPLALRARAQRAAVDEVGHALMCFDLAARHLGRPVRVEPFLAAPRRFNSRRDALAVLAVESLVDGSQNEGGAARRALQVAEQTRDDRVARVQSVIAVEERQHAGLGEDLARWAVGELAALRN